MRFGMYIFSWSVGLIWGAVWMVLVSLLAMLVTGLVMVPAIGASAIVGAVLGLIYTMVPLNATAKAIFCSLF